MEKSHYTVKKIKSSEHNNFAQKDILGIHLHGITEIGHSLESYMHPMY